MYFRSSNSPLQCAFHSFTLSIDLKITKINSIIYHYLTSRRWVNLYGISIWHIYKYLIISYIYFLNATNHRLCWQFCFERWFVNSHILKYIYIVFGNIRCYSKSAFRRSSERYHMIQSTCTSIVHYTVGTVNILLVLTRNLRQSHLLTGMQRHWTLWWVPFSSAISWRHSNNSHHVISVFLSIYSEF